MNGLPYFWSARDARVEKVLPLLVKLRPRPCPVLCGPHMPTELLVNVLIEGPLVSPAPGRLGSGIVCSKSFALLGRGGGA